MGGEVMCCVLPPPNPSMARHPRVGKGRGKGIGWIPRDAGLLWDPGVRGRRCKDRVAPAWD